jgi:hypothetical protein
VGRDLFQDKVMRWIWQDENGFVTGKAIFGILVIAFLVYLAASFFPLFNVPFNLDGQVKSLSQTWLRTPPNYRRASELKQFKDNIKQTIAKNLSPDNEYDEKNLVIEASLQSTKVKVQLPYTIVIRLLGSEFRYEKELLIEEAAWTF